MSKYSNPLAIAIRIFLARFARIGPDIYSTFSSEFIDTGKLIRRKLSIIQGGYVLNYLLRRNGADQGCGDSLVSQAPSDGHLSEALSTFVGYLIEAFYFLQSILVYETLSKRRRFFARPRILRDSL